MSNNIIEHIRSKHEEIEQLEKALAKAITYKDNNVAIFILTFSQKKKSLLNK
jgi:predicted neutral ceramidase superfamily lipid hydrolase